MAKTNTKTYDQEFKSQAVKLAQEIGGHKDVMSWAFQMAPFIPGLNRLRKDV